MCFWTHARVGRGLYSARQFPRLGRHFWDIFVHDQDLVPKVKPMPMYCSYVVNVWVRQGNLGLAIIIHYALQGVRPIVHVWRIQRGLRTALCKRRRERALALMMAWHSRLGSDSLIQCLPNDLVCDKILGSAK